MDEVFEFKGEAGALITVDGVPLRNGEGASEVYLVGIGDALGSWDLEESLELGRQSDSTWETIAALEMDRKFSGVLVAVYDDGCGTRFELADNLPLHSFVVNEGEKEVKFEGDIEAYDSFNISLRWHTKEDMNE